MTATLESEVEPMDLSVSEERPTPGGTLDAEMVSRTEAEKSPAGSRGSGVGDGRVRESGTAVEDAATAAEAVRSVGLGRRSSRSPPHSNKASPPLIGAAYSARHGLIPLPITTATNKQCWVALNKGIVYDLVESAMRDAGIGEDIDCSRAASAEKAPGEGQQPSAPVASTLDRTPGTPAVSCDSNTENLGRNSPKMEVKLRESANIVASPGISRSDCASINNRASGCVQTDRLTGRSQSPSIAKSQEWQKQGRPSSTSDNNKHSLSHLASANPPPTRRFCNAHSISDLLKDTPVPTEPVQIKEETNLKESDGKEGDILKVKSEEDVVDGRMGSVQKDVHPEESSDPGEVGQAPASRKHLAQVSMGQDIVPRGQTLTPGVGGTTSLSSSASSLGKRRRVLDDLTAHLLRHKVARSSTPTTSQAMPTLSGTPPPNTQLSHSFSESKTTLVNLTDSGGADPKLRNSLVYDSSEDTVKEKSTVSMSESPKKPGNSESKPSADGLTGASSDVKTGQYSNVGSTGGIHSMMASPERVNTSSVTSSVSKDSDKCAETLKDDNDENLHHELGHGKTLHDSDGIKTEEGIAVGGGQSEEVVSNRATQVKESIISGNKIGWSGIGPASVAFSPAHAHPASPSGGVGGGKPPSCTKRSPVAMSKSSPQRPTAPLTGTPRGQSSRISQTFSQKSTALPLTSRPAPNRFLNNTGGDSARAKAMRQRQVKDIPTRMRATFNPNKHGIVAISLSDKSSLYGQEAPRTSPRLGWIAVSKEDVHTIIDSMMESFIAEERSMVQTRASRANTPSGEVCENESDLPLNLSFSTASSDQTLKPIPGFNKSARILKESEQSPNELCDSDTFCDSPKDVSTDPKCSPGDWLNCDKDELRQQDFVKDTENLDVDMSTKKAFKWKSCLLERLNVETVSEATENTSQPIRRQAVGRRTKRTATTKLK